MRHQVIKRGDVTHGPQAHATTSGSHHPHAARRQCDKDGSGTITLPEFERLNALLNTVQHSFAAYDVDKDGRISRDELAAALSQLGARHCAPHTVRLFQ